MDDVIPQSESLSLRVASSADDDVISGGGENGCDGENGEEKSGGGGGITNFITSLVSPRSDTKSPDDQFCKRKAEDEDGVEIKVMNGENGGGGISNMIANFFNPSEEEVGNKRLKMDEKEEEEEEEGKGGLIDDIVSHLPTSIPDDAAPASDEATILIHSCVKD